MYPCHLKALRAGTRFCLRVNSSANLNWWATAFLDELLTAQSSRRRFVELAEAASAQLKGEFNSYLHGAHWLEVEIASLIARVALAGRCPG